MPRIAMRSRRGRFRRRRRFPIRRRVARAVRSMKRRTFKRSVQRIMLRKMETFKKYYTETQFTLAPGNGTTAQNVRIFAPWQSAFTQGTSSSQMTGTKVHLLWFQWHLFMQSELAGDVIVQMIFFKSDFQMDVTAANTDVNNEGTTMGATTTTTTNPTQVAPNGNIPMFDTTSAPGQFCGLSPVTPFNSDNIDIIWVKSFKFHGFGQAGTDPHHTTSLKFKFNKTVAIQKTGDTIDGVPHFFGPPATKRGNYSQYYVAIRTWGQDEISSTTAITVKHSGKLLWKDV